MPPRQRTNSMPTGQSLIIAWPSWPAPEPSRGALQPTAFAAAANASCSRGSQGVVGVSRVCVMARPRWRRSAMARASRAKSVGDGATRVVRRGAQIEREGDVAGNHIRRVRRHRQACRPSRPPRRGARAPVSRQTGSVRPRPPARRAAARIGTVPAWPASPDEFDGQIGLPGDRGDDAERLVGGLQHRALLDMDLDIGGDFVAPIRRPPECPRDFCRRP